MKIPPKVVIAGKEYKIKENIKCGGGSFNEGTGRIIVGTRYKKVIPEIFIHEVIEAILTARDVRYSLQMSSPENGDYLFSFNHREFEQIIKDVAFALKGTKF